jgi:hypothetical protein
VTFQRGTQRTIRGGRPSQHMRPWRFRADRSRHGPDSAITEADVFRTTMLTPAPLLIARAASSYTGSRYVIVQNHAATVPMTAGRCSLSTSGRSTTDRLIPRAVRRALGAPRYPARFEPEQADPAAARDGDSPGSRSSAVFLCVAQYGCRSPHPCVRWRFRLVQESSARFSFYEPVAQARGAPS